MWVLIQEEETRTGAEGRLWVRKKKASCKSRRVLSKEISLADALTLNF